MRMGRRQDRTAPQKVSVLLPGAAWAMKTRSARAATKLFLPRAVSDVVRLTLPPNGDSRSSGGVEQPPIELGYAAIFTIRTPCAVQ